MKAGLTRSTAWYTLGNLFVRSANFILLPFYSNFISPQNFGNYALLMSFYSISMVLYQGGYQAALNKYYLQEKDKQRQNSIFLTIGTTAVIGAVLLTILADLLSDNISSLIFGYADFSGLISLIAYSMLLETIGSQFINYLITTQRASKVVMVSVISAIVNFGLNIYLIYFLEMGISGIITAQLIAAAVTIAVLIPMIAGLKQSRFDYSFLRSLFRYTLPLIIGGLFSIGVDIADRFILNSYLGINDVGIYSFSYRIALIMNLFVISFRTAWMPYSIKLYYDKSYKENYGSILLKYITAAGFIYICVGLLTNELFTLRIGEQQLFNPLYRGGLIILPFILGGYFLNGINSFFSVYPFVSDKTYHFIFSDAIGFFVNVVLNLIFIPYYGIAGAGIATLISFAAVTCYLYLLSSKHITIVYQVKKIIGVLSAIILITITGIILNNFIADIILLSLFLYIVLFVLKIKPSGLFINKRLQEM